MHVCIQMRYIFDQIHPIPYFSVTLTNPPHQVPHNFKFPTESV